VLYWIARGKNCRATVNKRAQRATHKLGAQSRAQDVAIAVRDGIIQPSIH
jgi:hypothetical protein